MIRMDKPKEFWIFPQKGNDCEWTNLYPDASWKSETKPLVHVIEYSEVELLKAKLDKACEALEFYAEPDEWDTNKISTIDVEDVNIDGVSTNAPWGYPIVKGGKYARETLQKIKEEIL